MEKGQQMIDAIALSGVGKRLGQLPVPVGSVESDLQLPRSGRPDGNGANRLRAERRQDFGWGGDRQSSMVLEKKDKGKKPTRNQYPNDRLLGAHPLWLSCDGAAKPRLRPKE